MAARSAIDGGTVEGLSKAGLQKMEASATAMNALIIPSLDGGSMRVIAQTLSNVTHFRRC